MSGEIEDIFCGIKEAKETLPISSSDVGPATGFMLQECDIDYVHTS
jgi:hypothetical protein